MGRHTAEELAAEVIARQELLQRIQELSPVSATALERDVDISVSTINRVVSRFERERFLERTTDGIVLTAAGRALLSESERFVEAVDTVSDFQPLLEGLEEVPPEFETNWLREATVTTASPNNPYAPLSRYSKLFFECERKRLVGDQFVVPESGVEVAMREIGSATDCTCVWTEPALERLATQHPEVVEWSGNQENLTAKVTDSVPLDFALFDERLLVYGFDENGTMSVLADTDDQAAFKWGVEMFEQFLGEASPIEL